jgi:hypothetical protein
MNLYFVCILSHDICYTFFFDKTIRVSKLWIVIRKDEHLAYVKIIKYSGPEKTTGPSGVIPIAVLKEESNVEI